MGFIFGFFTRFILMFLLTFLGLETLFYYHGSLSPEILKTFHFGELPGDFYIQIWRYFIFIPLTSSAIIGFVAAGAWRLAFKLLRFFSFAIIGKILKAVFSKGSRA